MVITLYTKLYPVVSPCASRCFFSRLGPGRPEMLPLLPPCPPRRGGPAPSAGEGASGDAGLPDTFQASTIAGLEEPTLLMDTDAQERRRRPRRLRLPTRSSRREESRSTESGALNAHRRSR